MRSKRYTARDIGTMRQACLDLIRFPRLSMWPHDDDDEQAERMLRTYMDNGVPARELVAEAERVRVETRPALERYQKNLLRELDKSEIPADDRTAP
jgi:hypothetical protein